MAQEFTQEDIDNYLKGNLDKKDLASFRQKLAEDEAFAEAVKLQRAEKRIQDWVIKEYVLQNEDKWRTIAKQALEEDKGRPVKYFPPNFKKNWWLFLIPLIIIIAGILFLPRFLEKNESKPSTKYATLDESLKNKSPEERLAYVSEVLKSPPSLDIIRTKGNQNNSTQDQTDHLTSEYNAEAYQNTLDLLSTQKNDTNNSDLVLQIEAYSHFGLESYDNAIPLLIELSQNSTDNVRSRAEWYLLLCYLATYDQNAQLFRALLDKIALNPNSRFQEAAKDLKQAIVPN